MNRQRGSKLKPSISALYEEEVAKSASMSRAAAPTPNRPISDYHHERHGDNHQHHNAMWNDSGWHDKPYESTSHKVCFFFFY